MLPVHVVLSSHRHDPDPVRPEGDDTAQVVLESLGDQEGIEHVTVRRPRRGHATAVVFVRAELATTAERAVRTAIGRTAGALGATVQVDRCSAVTGLAADDEARHGPRRRVDRP